jgi:predicted phosphodiesterase
VGALPGPGCRRRGGGDGLTAPPGPVDEGARAGWPGLVRGSLEVVTRAAGRIAGLARRSAPWSLPLLAGGAGALLAVGLLARTEVHLGPATVRLAARPALTGSSTLAVPPFGSVAARTHLGPVAFTATLEGVDVPALSRLIERGSTRGTRGPRTSEQALAETVTPLERAARRAVGWFLAKVALLGLAGGAAAVLVFGRRSRRLFLRSLLGGALATLALLGPAVATYNVSAFSAPRYQGALEYAPTLIGDVRTGIDRLADLRAEMIRISENLNRAYAAIGQTQPALDGRTIRILHMSDVHLNPAGIDLAQRLARQFDVAAVVDTGDMGTWGFAFERGVPQRVAGFGVPYLFVKGNHDNAAMVAAVAANPNARVLDHATAEVDGIRFYGVADPTFSPGQGYRAKEFDALKQRRSVQVAAELDRLEPPADVLLVHDGRLATYAAGHVATVLSGHYHRFDTSLTAGTRSLVSGSVGAAGPDGLRASGDVPYEAEVLYLDRVTHRPVAVDRISVRSLDSSFAVDRELLTEGEVPFSPAPLDVPESDTPRPGDPAQVVETPSPGPLPLPPTTPTTRP